jgi:hypothetical protein
MKKPALNRREAGFNMISSATKVMAVGAIGLTGSVALLADHIYNVQHATAHTVTSNQSATSVSSTSGDDGSGFSSTVAPSVSSSSSSSTGGSSSAIVSGGS